MKILTRLRKYQADLKLRWVHMPEGTFSDVDVFFFSSDSLLSGAKNQPVSKVWFTQYSLEDIAKCKGI